MSFKRILPKGKWIREFDFELGAKVFFSITTDKYIVQLTGGSIIILDKDTKNELNRIRGYNYLYTGDVKPDETEVIALENGKHFYVYSLEDFLEKKRVTLPRGYEAIDVYGEYSLDGKFLYIPVYKYVGDGYKYCLCEYETKSYSLVNMKEIEQSEMLFWPLSYKDVL